MKRSIWTKLLAMLMILAMLVGVMAGCGDSDEDGAQPVGDTPVLEDVPEDPREYMLFVEKRGVSALSDSISGAYGQLTETLGGTGEAAQTNGLELQLELAMGDKLIEALKTQLTTEAATIDPSFLSRILVTAGIANQDDLQLLDVKLALGDTHILGANMVIDQANGAAYLGLPELNDRYLKGSVNISYTDQLLDAALEQVDMEQIKEQLLSLRDALPSEEILGETLQKYLILALEQLNNVEKTTETVTLGGVSQEMTVLTLTITEQDARNALKVLLEAAKEDANILQVCQTMNTKLAEVATELGQEFPMDLTEAYKQGIDAALEELSKAPESENSQILLVKTYTNNQHQVVGRSFTFGEQLLGAYLFAESQDAFAVEAKAATVTVMGNGTKNAGAYTGRFTVNDGQQDLLAVELRNYDPAKNTDGNVDLDLRVIPSQGAIDMSAMNSFGYNGDAAIGLRCVNDSVVLSALVGEDVVFSVKLAAQPKNYQITVPQDAVDSSSNMALIGWVTSLNMDALMTNLETAGVPVDLVEDLLYELVGNMIG